MSAAEAVSIEARSLYQEVPFVIGDSAEAWVMRPGTDAEAVLEASSMRIDPIIFMKQATPHPLTRRMTQGEEDMLLAAVREHGVLEDVYVTADGKPVDGFHRLYVSCRLRAEEGKAPHVNVKFVHFASKAAEAEFVLLRNLTRRHLTLEDQTAMTECLLKDGHRGTDGFLSSLTTLCVNTVKRIRLELENAEQIPVLPERIDKNGKVHKRRGNKTVLPKQTPIRAKQQVRDQPSEPAHQDSCSRAGTVISDPIVPTASKGATAETSDAEALVESLNGRVNQIAQSSEESIADLGTKPTTDTSLSPFDVALKPEIVEADSKLLAIWWNRFGIEPITSSALVDGLESEGLGSEEGSQRSKECKVGHKLKKLVALGKVGAYVISSLDVGSFKVYQLRPAAWSKHGPI